MAHLVITAVGPDRPGIVGELTGHLHAAGGNILESRMVNLRGEFAVLVLLECADDAAAQIVSDLPRAGESIGLRVTATRQPPPTHEAAGRAPQGIPYRLKTYSMDQPGIVARITKVLRDHGVNIEELEARQESAPFAGSPLFLTEMRLTVPPTVPLGKLRRQLETLGDEINCDIDLDPADA